MKTVMLVLLQSFILTVFFTAMAETYMPTETTAQTHSYQASRN